MQQVDFYYDIVSPYSYLAATQMKNLTTETGVEVVWKPIFLGGLFKQLGNAAPLSNLPKKHYMFTQDMPRLARFYQLPYSQPEVFPTNTLLVQRALAAVPQEQRPALSLKLYDFYWGQGQDIAPMAVAEAVLGTDIAALGQTEAAKAALKALTDELVARGGFGAPTLIWQDQLYFGADRVQLLKADLLTTKG